MPRLACLFCCVLLCHPATASTAVALLDRAQAHYESHGRNAALHDFTHAATFRMGPLYVFCVDRQGRMSASGGFPKMVGVNIDRFEVGGRSGLATLMQERASEVDEGSVAYEWLNPQSGSIEPKQVRFRRFGEDVCGVGEYQPRPTTPPRRR